MDNTQSTFDVPNPNARVELLLTTTPRSMKIGNTNTEENNMILITNTKTKVQYTCEDSQLERACIEIAGEDTTHLK